MSSRCLNSKEIKAQAMSLGFIACGLSKAEPVKEPFASQYLKRIQLGYYAGMSYMERNVEMRLYPELLHAGVKTIVSLALNYMPQTQQSAICLYAQGEDYHEVMRKRMYMLMKQKELAGRCFVDSAPVLERYWAWHSGVGTFCRNGLISVPGYGPTVFLGELFLEQEADSYDSPQQPIALINDKGWEKLCPALTPEGLDARLCQNYWTIEHKGSLPEDMLLKHTFYGCDRCMRACKEFSESHPTSDPSFQPSPELLLMNEHEWRTLSLEQFRELFRHSAVKRAKYEGLMRNIAHWKP